MLYQGENSNHTQMGRVSRFTHFDLEQNFLLTLPNMQVYLQKIVLRLCISKLWCNDINNRNGVNDNLNNDDNSNHRSDTKYNNNNNDDDDDDDNNGDDDDDN